MASSSRGSKLESDSCPDYGPISEMERLSRFGDTRSSGGRPVHGATESDGCQPIRQTLHTTEQNRESKTQVGHTGNDPVGGFTWSHGIAQQTQGPRMENLMAEQRPFGSGTPANTMTFRPSPEQRPFGSVTPANTMTFHPSPEQRPLGSGTYLGQMIFRPSLEQKPFGSATLVNPMTYYERQPSREQRSFGSGTFADPTTVTAKQSLLEQRAFSNGTMLSRSSPEHRTSPMSSGQLLGVDDDVMEDREQSDEESRRSFITTSMESFSIEDNDVPLPEQATASESVDPALFAQDEDGDTYLHMAIISEHTDLALCLIHLAPDPQWLNQTNKLNQTPLHLATFRRHPKVIRRLLHGGAKRVVHDLRGNTPLHIACSNGHLDCVQELTSSDPVAPPVMTIDDLGFNQSNYEGQTCLHLAASKNQLDVIRYLVEDCGVNVNQKELRRGCTILHRAVATSNLALLDYLLRLPSSAELIIDDPTYDGYTALHLARLTKQTHVEQMLLSAGAHPITIDYNWPSPEAEM
jgi:ankyrin repeat protein